MKIDLPLLLHDKHLQYSDIEFQYYGSLPNNFPTGRPNDTELVSKEKFFYYVKRLRENKIEFNYLFNANIKESAILKYASHIEWVIKVIKPNIITFSSPDFYKYIKKQFDFNNFEISAISGIRNESDFNYFLENGKIEISDIKKIVLHHDFTIDGENSLDFIIKLQRLSIEPRVLVTESCYYRCPYRKMHYDSLINAYDSFIPFFDCYQFDCIIKRLINPLTLLNFSGYLLPEQLEAYSKKTGIENFKISGRSKSSEWIYNTAQYYINRKSPENLFDILVFTSPLLDKFNMEIKDLFYLDSKAYNEIYYELIDQTTPKLRQSFLKKKAAELFLAGKLKINDPNSQYDVINGELRLIKKGNYLKRLVAELDKYLISNNMRKLKAAFEKSYERTY